MWGYAGLPKRFERQYSGGSDGRVDSVAWVWHDSIADGMFGEVLFGSLGAWTGSLARQSVFFSSDKEVATRGMAFKLGNY